MNTVKFTPELRDEIGKIIVKMDLEKIDLHVTPGLGFMIVRIGSDAYKERERGSGGMFFDLRDINDRYCLTSK